MKKNLGLLIIIGIIAILAVALVVYRFVFTDLPEGESEPEQDRQRLNNLREIDNAISAYYESESQLPASLEIISDLGWINTQLTKDPETDEQYGYLQTGATSYDLCANFTSASTNKIQADSQQWSHPSGYHCFALSVESQEAGKACDAFSGCGQGETCVKLPGRAEPVCVVAGQECEAADCPDKCLVLESYPIQIRCQDEDAVEDPVDFFELPEANCMLMKNNITGEVDCFGCANKVCTTPSSDWEEYTEVEHPGYVGIPYSCFAGDNGCELAQ